MLYKAKSSIHGFGLFSSQPIKKGESLGFFELKVAKREGKFTIWITELEDDEYYHASDGLIRLYNLEEFAYNVTSIHKYSNQDEENPNAYCEWNENEDKLEMIAVCYIEPHEEITWSYISE